MFEIRVPVSHTHVSGEAFVGHFQHFNPDFSGFYPVLPELTRLCGRISVCVRAWVCVIYSVIQGNTCVMVWGVERAWLGGWVGVWGGWVAGLPLAVVIMVTGKRLMTDLLYTTRPG